MVNQRQSYKYTNRPKRYTFFNMGTGYAFDPMKSANVSGKLSNLLEFHKAEVRFRKRKDIFILTETGEVLKVD